MLDDLKKSLTNREHISMLIRQHNNSMHGYYLEDKCTYQLLIEHIPAITYVAAMDDASSTLYTSPQIERVMGFTQAEWMRDNQLWFKQIHPEDQDLILTDLLRIRSGGETVAREYRMLNRAGQIKWFRDDSAVLSDESGVPLLLYGTMLDITEQKQLEAKLTQARERLLDNLRKSFSKRELGVLQLIKEGKTDREISQMLSISERTVGYCLQSVYAKLGVRKRIEALREAIEQHLLD